MSPFARIEALAAKRKGGVAGPPKLLPKPRSRAALAKTPEEFFLSALAKQVFRAGFVWQIVERKWPSMEEAFGGFRPEIIGRAPRARRRRPARRSARDPQSREDPERAGECRLDGPRGGGSRQLRKLRRRLASRRRRGPVGRDASEGSRLGGMTGPFVLREVGRDTFLLTTDVVRALRREERS